MNKRKNLRFTKRLEARFIADGESFVGITSNLSETGLFIRTKRGFAPDSILDIKLIMPDGNTSSIKGIVKRTVKVPLSIKNGMGIELLEKDETYMRYVKSLREGDERSPDKKPVDEFQIIPCPSCQAKNKVRRDKIALGPRCGKCKTPLII
ncbi:MAG TPA: PilZ domain-containing protein [Thermodesulfovibrionales bacterium]|nr:PilZ domain-containing protein [Thermodesulfovibrionales bacterium]